jgi:predicted nucleotidyltransferase
VLYLQPDQTFHVRHLIRLVGHGQGAVQRELRRLTEAGLLLRTVRGRQVYYQANREAAVFAELQGLLLKTVGLADVLRAALAPLASEVQVAFVYGSLASGRFGARSDVDLLLVGDAPFREVASALAPTQDILGREVNPSVYSVEDLQQRVAEGNHFLLSVLHESKIFILGGEDDLARLVAQRVVDRAPQ